MEVEVVWVKKRWGDYEDYYEAKVRIRDVDEPRRWPRVMHISFSSEPTIKDVTDAVTARLEDEKLKELEQIRLRTLKGRKWRL